MKVLFINSVCGIGSTGHICTNLAQQLEAEGNEVRIAYGRKGTVPDQFKKYGIRIGTDWDCKLHAVLTRLFDIHGFSSKRATKRFLEWAENYKPDLLWLHNLHGYYVNVEMLFEWIKKHPEMEVKWTLHDCWPFTGHCTHFSMAKCVQWKKHCLHCSQLRRYPACFIMSSVGKNFERKRSAFTGVNNMTLIAPSKWLADLTRQSFLNCYSVEVRYNTVDTNIFKPTRSDFRERYSLQNKIVVLGVANIWEEKKGLFDFYKLAKMLDERYAVVLVGLSAKQIKVLPTNIRGIERTNNLQELAAIYTAADVLVNPSVEEAFGMTQVEALACGTPSIVYEGTACEEIAQQNGNIVVPQNVNALYDAIVKQKYIDGAEKNHMDEQMD